MNSIDLIQMGLKNLFRRKTRTFLTILGVIIGSAAIVIMLSLGFGMKDNFQQGIEEMGSMTTIDVYSGGGGYGYGMAMPQGGGKSGTLDDKAIAKIGKIDGVLAVTPIMERYLKIVSGKYYADVSLKGILPETMKYFDYKVEEGRLLDKDDGNSIVLGHSIPMQFMDVKNTNNYYYNPPKPGDKPKVNVMTDKLQVTFDWNYGMKPPPGMTPDKKKQPLLFKVKTAGILAEDRRDGDYSAFISIHELKDMVAKYEKYQSKQGEGGGGYGQGTRNQKGYDRVIVKVKDIKDVSKVQDKINNMGFQTNSLNDILKSMEKTSATLQIILGGIGAISLLVAALGITNTMIMSIYERTREIGVMKVIGASLNDIKKLFLFESGMIGFLGGVFGLAISLILSTLANTVGKGIMEPITGPAREGARISIVPVWLMFAVIGFTTLVGLISGYYPAKRAMKLSALEAIKNE